MHCDGGRRPVDSSAGERGVVDFHPYISSFYRFVQVSMF